jgi:hypothetical protein
VLAATTGGEKKMGLFDDEGGDWSRRVGRKGECVGYWRMVDNDNEGGGWSVNKNMTLGSDALSTDQPLIV